MTSDLLFKIEDYVILAVTLLLSAGLGLFESIIKHKQTTVAEYFLAGRKMSLILVQLSYFSTHAAGGLNNWAIETYLFGAQPMIFILITPLVICFINQLVVPVFYRLNSISILKYFEIRFGRTVHNIALLEIVLLMVTIGSLNLYIASIAIQQGSGLSLWVCVAILIVICIIYSSLGGMRGIVIADTIQAVIMIIALLFIIVVGVIRSGGPEAIWDINKMHDRLQIFDTRVDPTITYTVWTVLFGYGPICMSYQVISQTLLQRCLMAPNLKAAQKIATIGSTLTFIYTFGFQALGLIIFSFYLGCHVVHTGKITSINQLIPYYSMEILHSFPCFPGVFFSGILCTSLSTISSLLNSISAVIVTHIIQIHSNILDNTITLICKLLVVAFGGVLSVGVLVISSFQNVMQAGTTLAAITSGPIFAIYCIGILCPQANHKAAATAFVMAIMTTVWILIGSMVAPPVIVTSPFANNCSITSANATTNFNHRSLTSNIANYFPLSNVAYMYLCSEEIAITIICFILTSIILAVFNKTETQPVSQLTLDLIPHCIRRLQLKMSRRMRRMLLCDVYDDANPDGEQQSMTEREGNI